MDSDRQIALWNPAGCLSSSTTYKLNFTTTTKIQRAWKKKPFLRLSEYRETYCPYLTSSQTIGRTFKSLWSYSKGGLNITWKQIQHLSYIRNKHCTLQFHHPWTKKKTSDRDVCIQNPTNRVLQLWRLWSIQSSAGLLLAGGRNDGGVAFSISSPLCSLLCCRVLNIW